MLSKTTTVETTQTISDPKTQYVMQLDARSDLITITAYDDSGRSFTKEFSTANAPASAEELAAVRAFCERLFVDAIKQTGFEEVSE